VRKPGNVDFENDFFRKLAFFQYIYIQQKKFAEGVVQWDPPVPLLFCDSYIHPAKPVKTWKSVFKKNWFQTSQPPVAVKLTQFSLKSLDMT